MHHLYLLLRYVWLEYVEKLPSLLLFWDGVSRRSAQVLLFTKISILAMSLSTVERLSIKSLSFLNELLSSKYNALLQASDALMHT